jgi:hypothetical protein
MELVDKHYKIDSLRFIQNGEFSGQLRNCFKKHPVPWNYVTLQHVVIMHIWDRASV